MKKTGVVHITDTLDLGGYERVAVNLANYLPRDAYVSKICTTRRDGPLSALVSPDVERLALNRRHTFDWTAFRRLVRFLREREVAILHAHGASLFIARAAAMFPPHPAVVWHAHFGRFAALDHSALRYRLAVRNVSGVIAVNEPLLEWARRRLGVPVSRSWYVPNLVSEPRREDTPADLPGVPGSRVVCVANLRPEKDHITLLRAMALVAGRVPSAHLLMVGATVDAAYEAQVRAAAAELGLTSQVSFLGQRTDVASILRASDIGVLSSTFEGLPMALLEYGMQGLAVVATTAGQCAEVLDQGRAGVLVPSADPERLAQGLLHLLQSPERRARYGNRLRHHVTDVYSPRAVIKQVCAVYSAVLGRDGTPEPAGVPSAKSFTPVGSE